jgi:uncharacterized OB-fold protein
VTADANLVCRRCGFANVPGDTFCGSCGAFLEWEGEQAADTTTTTPTGPGSVAGPPPGPGTVPYPAPAPGPAPAPTPAAPAPAPAPAAGDLVRCPACGVANAANRTFCQACGTKLADAGKVGTTSQDQIVAAVNAPNKPVTVTTTTLRKTDDDEQRGGGVLKWIALMAILGVLVGVGVVLGGNLIRGEGPQSGASPAPSSGPTVAPSGSGAATESDAPSGEPSQAPENEPLALKEPTASSVVGNREKFQPGMAIDGDPETAWQEGAEDEAGQWIQVQFAPSTVSAVRLTNGYNASKALYKGNQRLREIEITVNDGVPFKAELKDTGDPQTINIPNVEGATSLRITIVSTYPAKKTAVQGTPFDDAALGEIVVMGVPGS